MRKYFFITIAILIGLCFVPTKQESDSVFAAHYPYPSPIHTIDMPSIEEMIQEFEATR